MENVYLKEKKNKKSSAGSETFRSSFPLSAAKILFFSRSIIICNSSNCATSLSVHVNYECESYMSFCRTHTQRCFVPGIYRLNNQVHSILSVPTFYYVTNHYGKELFFYCFEHLYMKDIMSQEQLFICPVHFTLEENFFLPGT